jgi:hypothetical protein
MNLFCTRATCAGLLSFFFAATGMASLGAAPAPGDDLVRTRIELTLAAMSGAAMAGNQEAYLAMVCAADPVFHAEQKAWAADLERHLPERLDFALTSELDLAGEDATANLRITWQMPEGRVRTVSYPARFTRNGDAWLYAGEHWQSTAGDRVLVMHGRDQREVAQNAAGALPEIREHIIAEMGLEDDEEIAERVQQIKIYTSVTHLQFSIYMSYTDGLAGWNEPGESIKLLVSRDIGRRSLRMLLGHEYGHVASFQYGPRATDMPWWILEGVAELMAERWASNGERTDRTIRQWAATGQLRDWDLLADFRGEALNHTLHVYRQGHQMMRFMTERFGKDARNRWMIELSQGATLDEATRKLFDMSFAELDALWREGLTERAPEPVGRGRQWPPAAPAFLPEPFAALVDLG